jgi:hypothetical protein
MTTNITGFRNSEPWPAPGDELEVGEAEGGDLIANGYAEGVADPLAPAESATETDSDTPVEVAVEGEPTVPRRTRKAPSRKAPSRKSV